MHSDLRGSVIDKNRKNLDSSEREILDSIKTEKIVPRPSVEFCVFVCERGREEVMMSLILSISLKKKKMLTVFRPFFAKNESNEFW